MAATELQVTIHVDTSRFVQELGRLAQVWAQIGPHPRQLVREVLNPGTRHRSRVVTRAKQRRRW